tara:strand:+ start:153 stop:332 length:180 start_codon:yes stop_codon:yes gene_type:complete
MTEFVTYTVYSDCDPKAMTRNEYEMNGGLPDDWDDYVWHHAVDAETAIKNHEDALETYL